MINNKTLSEYKDELLSIDVISRVLGIEKYDIKLILKKIKANPIRRNYGSAYYKYSAEILLKKRTITEFSLVSEKYSVEDIEKLLIDHLNIIKEKRKQEEIDILNISIDPKQEVENAKKIIRENKIKNEELDKKRAKEIMENAIKTGKSVLPNEFNSFKFNIFSKFSKEERKIKRIKESKKRAYKSTKDNLKKYPYLKLSMSIRTRISYAIKNNKKLGLTIDLVGCSIRELRIYLQSKFKDGMCWDNYNHKTWHVDHIIPCNAFDFRNKDAQFFCFHYTNLQPLWAKENLKKSDRIDYEYLLNIGVNPDILKFRYRKILLELISKKNKNEATNE